MNLKCYSLLMLLLVGVFYIPASAGEMLLGFNGKTKYQLVTVTPQGQEQIDQSIVQATSQIVDAFAAQDIKLAVVTEADHDASKPSIYLGNTRFARDNGVTFEPGQGWTYTWKVVGDNLIIAGNDEKDPIALDQRQSRNARYGGRHYTGTLKSAVEFLYSYVGTRYVQPGVDGIVHLATPVIFIPDDLNITRRPWGRDTVVLRSMDTYGIANGLEPASKVFTHYGHFHGIAFNEDDVKKHPEYFIFRAGKRQTSMTHYCFSNPEVRERIYQKILEECDKGFDVIEVGQMDGFTPCGCQACYDLYNVHPTHTPEQGRLYLMDAAWGEKLWIMHRDFAHRLLKDRPGKKLMVSAYSVARNPPKTFSSLPPNIIVQIMRPEPQIMKDWSALDVPGGYSVYTYTWGSFHMSGYTPRRPAQDIKDVVQLIVDHKMQILQQGGKPINYGIEGINIYVFYRMLNDPNAKPIETLYDEYIQAAYQEAAAPMASFYRRLHQRLLFMSDAMVFAREINRDPLLLFNTIYTPDLINALQESLNAAQKLAKDPGVKARLQTTAFEFEFLKQIATITTTYYAFLADPSPVLHNMVVDAVEARNIWLDSFKDESRKRQKDVIYIYPNLVAAMKKNGRFMNIEPFNWDVKARRKLDITITKPQLPDVVASRAPKSIRIDSPAWNKQPIHALHAAARNTGDLDQKTTFQVLYDDTNLYVRVVAGVKGEDMVYRARGKDAEMWLQECVNIQVGPGGDKSQYFYFNYEPMPNSFTDAEHGFITDPLHPSFGWNDNTWDGDWHYDNHLDHANNQWVSMVTIPYKTMRVPAPKAGNTWVINIGRVHFVDQKQSPDNKKNRQYASWAYDLNVSLNPGDGNFGQLVFE